MPQNFYCIHVDIKAEQTTKNSIAAIAKCFDNVFIASQLESVSKDIGLPLEKVF